VGLEAVVLAGHLQAHEGIEVPPGTPHQLRNESSADLHFLVISQPNSHGDRVAA
jgi:mannose-6-phosphate isomerase-like protein (cupin superfamily)